MATTCRLIASQTLSGTTADVSFTSIPSTFDDLILIVSSRTNRADTWNSILFEFNGSSSNKESRYLQGNGATAISFALPVMFVGIHPGNTATSSTFGNSEVYIPNYSGSTNKSSMATGAHETNASTAYIGSYANLWSNTSSITSIRVYPDASASFVSGSSFYLYGITKA